MFAGELLALTRSTLRFEVERLHVIGDIRELIFDGKVPRLQPVHFGVRQIGEARFAAFPGEEDVVLTETA